jgi:ribosomal protein L37E
LVKCSRCGKAMGTASVCPHCGYGPSQSVMSKTVGKAAKLTGKALETGVMVGETVVREVKPAVKTAVRVGKRGVSKAKEETLKVAKSLKEERN